MPLDSRFPDSSALHRALEARDYLSSEALTTTLFLAARTPQPVLLEGEPGVGKTAAAAALAEALGTRLVRLQCYEGIDRAEALYEWNFARQMLAIRAAEARGRPLEDDDLFAEEYLLDRPVLQAIRHAGPDPAVLLIDEIDRADHAFDAFLLEALADAAVTIPELGTIQATHPPIVVLTSNRTRELHDALKRRCLYHWIDFPDPTREAAIIRRRVPGSSRELAADVAQAISRLRRAGLEKPPGIAEALDWVSGLRMLGEDRLSVAAASKTLGAVVKVQEDDRRLRELGLAAVIAGDDE